MIAREPSRSVDLGALSHSRVSSLPNRWLASRNCSGILAMTNARFPLPVSTLGLNAVELCTAALDDALSRLTPEEHKILPGDATRFALANGIFIAATLGMSEHKNLVKAALDHFAQVTSWSIPLPEPTKREGGPAAIAPERYRRRAEELRAACGEVKSAECRDVLTAVSVDYERMAQAAERILTSRARLGG